MWGLSILTIVVGNVVAVLQTNVKRMLAYSAVAHAGYILIGAVTNSHEGFSSILFYLLAYTVMNLIAFSVIQAISGAGDSRVQLVHYQGLAKKAPFAAATLSLALISLAGIPLTGGFMGKFFLFSAAVRYGYVGLAIVGVLGSVISVFYYFRLMVFMYMKEPEDDAKAPEPMPWLVRGIIVLGIVLIFWLGIFPDRFVMLADNAIIFP